jgi:tyrosyl-tRNA synthetase
VTRHQAVGLSSPFLLKADGSKFGKSESGALWLDEKLTSPYEIYQYFLNASDQDVENFLKQLTLLSKSEIEALVEASQKAPELRQAQKVLASEIVTLVHGKDALDQALKVTQALFSGEFSELSKKGFGMLEQTLDSAAIHQETKVIDLLIETKLASSRREAREFIQSGAVTLNDQKITDLEYVVKKQDTLYETYIILRRGKKKYAIIVWK